MTYVILEVIRDYIQSGLPIGSPSSTIANINMEWFEKNAKTEL